MKAAVCYEFGQPLVIEDVHLDAPQTGEVRVKIEACAICHSDIHIAEGAWGGSLPAVYGHEAAGIVSEIGPNVKYLQVGDHVIVSLIRSCGRCFFCSRGQQYLCEREFALDRERRLKTATGLPIEQGIRTGGFAEHVVIDQSQVVTISKDLSFEGVSLLACGVITGLGAVVNTAQVPPGSSVVVIGTGGVGLNSVQGAVLSGAQPVIAIDLVDRKREAAKTFGATHNQCGR